MQYKTITLQMIVDRPAMHERLRANRMLLPSLEAYSTDFQASHEQWKETLRTANPDSDPIQVASEAMERAVKELETHLDSDSIRNETETFSLDAAMAYIRRPSSSE